MSADCFHPVTRIGLPRENICAKKTYSSALPVNSVKPDLVYVVIPVYNEAAILRETLTDVLGFGYNVVVVDDGSTDGSDSIAATLPVHILRHIINLGQGAALSTGMKYALLQEAKFIVTFDADGQHVARDIANLLTPLVDGRVDVALGSRFLEHRQCKQNAMPLARRILLKIAIAYTRLTTGIWFSDVHNGLRAFTAEAARQIHFRQNRMAHASEILSEIIRVGLTFTEVPVEVRYTPYSRRKGQRAFDAVNIFMDMLEGKLK